VAFVEGNGVSGHETAHDFAEWGRARPASRGISRRGRAGAQKDVKVVGDQGPSVALGLGFFEDAGEPFQERLTVLVVEEDLSSFYSPGHDVLEEAGSIKSGLARHFFYFFGAGFTDYTGFLFLVAALKFRQLNC